VLTPIAFLKQILIEKSIPENNILVIFPLNALFVTSILALKIN
jgi:hypothetical protein